MSTPESTAASAEIPRESATPRLVDLYDQQDFQHANEHVWPSMDSFKWFVRRHRARLSASGALLQIAGRNLIRGEAFLAETLRIGQDQAQAAVSVESDNNG